MAFLSAFKQGRIYVFKAINLNAAGGIMSSVEGKRAVAPRVLKLSLWWPVVLIVCLQPNICQSRNGSPEEGCLCASDILSCTALGLVQIPTEIPISTVTLDLSHNQIVQLREDSFFGLSRLETMRISHNRLTSVEPGAFRNSSGTLLRYLDLSSNYLRDVEQHYFADLAGLEELLLFNNRIVRVESSAFAKLSNLRKAYLSHNRLTDFPFFAIQQQTQPQLQLLDLSSNRLPKLPLEDISNLPIAVKKGLYLHNNSLLCDCSMYGLFHKWFKLNFTSVLQFKEDYTCLVYGMQKGTVRFLKHDRYFERCNLTGMSLNEQEGSVFANAGSAVLLHCATTLTGQHVTFFWVSPHHEYVEPPGNSDSLKMYSNGSLEIKAASDTDSGIYRCMALDGRQRRNETREVNLTVATSGPHESHESFNTGFTTLLGCVVTLVLVLMYLYLTPCPCPPCQKTSPPAVTATATQSHTNEAGAGSGSAQSSILTPTPPTTTEGPGRKVSTNKHVVFLEPIIEQQNGRIRVGQGQGTGARQAHPGLLLGSEHQSKLAKQSQQKVGENECLMSAITDTPIVLP